MVLEGRERETNVVVLGGGGIDTTSCLHQLRMSGFNVRILHIDFGQVAASREWAAVREIASFFDVVASQVVVNASVNFGGGEIVGRNAFLLLLAVMYRHPEDELICIGVHAGTPFYDCSPAFFGEMSTLVANLTSGRIRLIAPLLHLQKSEVITYCREHQVPIELTYSCQTGEAIPCGVCFSCMDRKAMGC